MVNSPGPFLAASAAGGGLGGFGASKFAPPGVAVGALYPCISIVNSPGPFLAPGRGEPGAVGAAGMGATGALVPDAAWLPVLNICVNDPGLLDSAGGGGGSALSPRGAGPPKGGAGGRLGPASGGSVLGAGGTSMPGDFVPDAEWLPVRNICVNEPAALDSAGGGGSGARPRELSPSEGVVGA